MQVVIENIQTEFNVDDKLNKLIENVVLQCLKHIDFDTPSEINIILVSNEQIKDINREERQIDIETDVLSFPIVEMEDGKIISDEGDVDLLSGLMLLGDIVISLEKATSQALEYGHSFEREVGFLTAHGLLHLLGYDHETNEKSEVMFKIQNELLNSLGLTR